MNKTRLRLLTKTGVVERMDAVPENLFFQEHLARYKFACTKVTSGFLLDIASGTGYGTQFLKKCLNARLLGVDINLDALQNCKITYQEPGLSFLQASGICLPFKAESFHNIISFETIEHIQDDHGFLNETHRVLKPGGYLVLSTPNRKYSEKENRYNPYHIREYDEYELIDLLRNYFHSVDLYYQGFSQSYGERISVYRDAIQSNKQAVHPVKQFVIDHIYHPVKEMVPAGITNWFIQRWFKVRYPQPDPLDIQISKSPPHDTNVLIALCQS
jgi:ubiquinone/menaquinone biosynthesis C-methylase UbiE